MTNSRPGLQAELTPQEQNDERIARKYEAEERSKERKVQSEEQDSQTVAQSLAEGSAMRKRRPPSEIYQANFDPTYPRQKKQVLACLLHHSDVCGELF